MYRTCTIGTNEKKITNEATKKRYESTSKIMGASAQRDQSFWRRAPGAHTCNKTWAVKSGVNEFLNRDLGATKLFHPSHPPRTHVVCS